MRPGRTGFVALVPVLLSVMLVRATILDPTRHGRKSPRTWDGDWAALARSFSRHPEATLQFAVERRGFVPMAFHQLLEARAVLQQTRYGQDRARSPVVVVHRGPWWRRLRWAVLQFILRRVKPSSPRVQ